MWQQGKHVHIPPDTQRTAWYQRAIYVEELKRSDTLIRVCNQQNATDPTLSAEESQTGTQRAQISTEDNTHSPCTSKENNKLIEMILCCRHSTHATLTTLEAGSIRGCTAC